MENLFKSYYQLIQAADECVSKHMALPALVLIYTSIDSVGWIASEDPNEQPGHRFKNWVNTWMLKDGELKCSAEELYAARCGILHRLTPDSTLSEKKGVRIVAYAYGKAKHEQLEEYSAVLEINDKVVSVHLKDLFWSFKKGFANYLEHVFSNDRELEKFLIKSGQHYATVNMVQMDELLQSARAIKT